MVAAASAKVTRRFFRFWARLFCCRARFPIQTGCLRSQLRRSSGAAAHGRAPAASLQLRAALLLRLLPTREAAHQNLCNARAYGSPPQGTVSKHPSFAELGWKRYTTVIRK